MSKHAKGSYSLRVVVWHRVCARLWVRAIVREDKAKRRYQKAYENRYGVSASWDML
jgi:hypothetical protein